ncbi:hypothetical protein O4H61_01125 [Roseovarius aestuarii]|nr:hypothetical protein [Roseovarius aestuarii]
MMNISRAAKGFAERPARRSATEGVRPTGQDFARESSKATPKARDWSEGSVEEHLDIVRRAASHELPALAVSYDWEAYPEPVLGWVMAQKTIDLGTAVAVFQKGMPERFNYIHKRSVPYAFRATARLLDNICLRMNCGFYLPQPVGVALDDAALAHWMDAQRSDRETGACGRWVLDETILSSLENSPPVSENPEPADISTSTRAGWMNWRAWLPTRSELREEILTRD